MRDDDDPSRPVPRPFGESGPAVRHEIGCDLSRLSVDEIRARITLLEGEIARLSEDARQKERSRDAASALFRF